MKEVFLTPIEMPKPPHHTQIQIRCFSCKHFPVCLIKKDYMKTAILIEGILGNPPKNYEVEIKEGIHIGTKDIVVYRGDTKYIKLIVKNQDGSDYTYEEGDTIRFAMKEKIEDEQPTLLKQIDPQTLMLKFESVDTESLPMDSIYYYDIELTRANGDVATFLKGRVIITKEVY